MDYPKRKPETSDSGSLQEVLERLEQLEERLNHFEQVFHKHKTPEQLPSLKAEKISPPKPAEKPIKVETAKEEPLLKEPLSPSQVPSLEHRIGARWLNRVGVIAIIIAMGFFLKYAFDNRWIGEVGRIVLGFLTGLGMLVIGELAQKKKYHWFGQGLSGAGIAIFYLCIFVSFNFYHLIPEILALLLIIMVTLAAVALSLRYNVMGIAILAVLGGFITPYLLETGPPKPVPVFTYILLIDLGVLAIAYFKKWLPLNIVTFIFTVIAFWGWYGSYYEASQFVPAFPFATAFFVVFASLGVIYNVINLKKMDVGDFFVIVVTPVLFFAFSFDLFMPRVRDSLVITTIGLAAFYFAIGSIALRRNPKDRYLSLTLLAVGLAFVIIAIPLRLEQHWITIGWVIEACILIIIGFRMKDWRVRRAGLILLSLGLFRVIVFDSNLLEYGERYLFLHNRRAISLIASIAGTFLTAWLYQDRRDELQKNERGISTLFALAGTFLLLWTLSAETIDFYHARMISRTGPRCEELRYAQQLSLSGLWNLFAIALVTIGIVKRNLALRISAMVLFGITIFKVFIIDLVTLQRIYRICSLLGLGIILLIVSYLYQRFRHCLTQPVRKVQSER